AGIEDRPFLTAREMTATAGTHHGGLIVVGSHTQKTTEQLQEVIAQFQVQTIEISVAELLDEASRKQELKRVRNLAEKAIAGGQDT
ncbi:nucleotide-binding domain containing protein, partial [Bacillus sp. SIMBA_069]